MKRFNILLISVFLITLALPVVAFSATLCVNPGGTGNCYGTIQAAVNAAAPGDVIQVYEGIYYENVYIPAGTHSIIIEGVKVTTSRVKGRGTTIAPADPTKVIVDAYPLGGTASGPGFWLDGAGNVTIRNLTVRHADIGGGSSEGANIYSTGAFTMIENVHSVSSSREGIYIIADDATVRNSHIAGNDWRGIFIDGDRSTIQSNTIWNNNRRAIGINSHDATIVGNDIRNVEDGNCIEIISGNNAMITDNFIESCGSNGIYLSYGTNALVAMNTIQSISFNGIHFYYMNSSLVTGNDIQGCSTRGIHGENGGGGNNTYSNNTVQNTGDDNYRIYEENPTVTGNTALYSSDQDGFEIMCSSSCGSPVISNNYATGASDDDEGFYLDVDNATISNNTAEHNNEEGLQIEGNNNTITGNTARYNGTQSNNNEEGIEVNGDGNTVMSNTSEYNFGRGFQIIGNNTVTNNTSSNNYRTGINLASTNGGTLTLDSNTVTNNHGEGIANNATTGTVNVTNNTSTGNRLDVCNDGTITTFTGNTIGTGTDTTACDLE